MTSVGERIEGHVQLVRVLINRDGVDLDTAITTLGPLIPELDRDAVRQMYHAQTSTTIRVLEPNVLADGGPRKWFEAYDPSKGYYWRRQRSFLAVDLHRKDFEIDSLDKSSNKVLGHLEDPHSSDGFAIRGLVVGHVQSGKTANFSALIAKAGDAGYKIVIVLSGLHNTLRQQTQRRLERDLGRKNVPGVGEPEARRRWQWMTGAEIWGDFDPGSTDASMLQGNEHVIFVVKKNKTRLERLVKWMTDAVPPDVAVLVVDDEADQASINTGGNRVAPKDEVDLAAGVDFDGDDLDPDELDPSAINLNIRLLLRSFNKCSYVAYTATPFANVLIDPSASDAEGGDDLFPSHFIISLPPPPGENYVGAAQLFGRDRLAEDGDAAVEDGLDVIEFVPDAEISMLIPPRRQRAGFIPAIPKSMKQALLDFVLASAGWLERSGEDQPCTMLIHTDMQRAMQNPLRPDVVAELAYIRQQWLYEADVYRPAVKQRWDRAFRPVSASLDIHRDLPFEAIESHVDRLLRDGIEVRVLNSDWPDEADFDKEPTLKAVLIGGNKLSRGVTIEGLLVSYYVRETLYYDTLMQMARWFGYRGRYVDLTRIYSTKLLVSCFHDLATAEEDLRAQIRRYDREGLTPQKFVPKVRKHPLMAVTQPSKMRAAVDVTVSYAGARVQTLRVPEKITGELDHNFGVARKLFAELGPPDNSVGGKPEWTDVDPTRVTDFISGFQAAAQTTDDKQGVVAYIAEQKKHGELVRWRVLLACAAKTTDDPEWVADLAVQGRPAIPLILRSRLANDPTSLGVVTDPGDEEVGLTEAQLARAADSVREGKYTKLAEAVRAQRSPDEGLLIVYPISTASGVGRNAKNRKRLFERSGPPGLPLIAYAISFPESRSDAAVEYVAAPLKSGTDVS